MKKVLFLAIAAAVGVTSAYASMRATFTYINRAETGTYEKLLVTYNPGLCTAATVRPCSFITTIDHGATVSQTVIAADPGVVVGPANKKSLQ